MTVSVVVVQFSYLFTFISSLFTFFIYLFTFLDDDEDDDDDSDYEPFLGQLGRQNSKISTNCIPSTVSSGAIINEICDFVMEEYPR